MLIRYAGFRWLWIGQLLSQMGNAVFLVMGLWEIQLRSPFLLSIAGLGMTLPGALAVVGGAVVDRQDPRRVMLWTDVVRGVAVGVGLLLVAFFPGSLIPTVVVLLAINSLGASLFAPAESVVLPWLVDDADLPAANGIYSLTNMVSQALGSAVGGAALATIGLPVVFGLDMGSFWASALGLWLMMRTTAGRRAMRASPHPGHDGSGGFLQSLFAGWRGLAELPWFVRLMPLILGTNFAFTAAFTMLPYWSRHVLHTDALGFGLIDAAWSVGMVVGGTSTGLLRRWPVRVVTGVLALAVGALSLGFAASRWALLSGVLLALSGAANGILNALVFTVMQRAIPEAVRGRAFGLFLSLLTLATPTGALASGLALPVLPLWWSWALAGLVGCVLALVVWRVLPDDIPLASAQSDAQA